MKARKQHTRIWIWLFAVAFLTAIGCWDDGRPKTIPVAGTISIDGKPAPNGRVNFYPVSGERSATGRIINGKFRMTTFRGGDGVIVGTHKVTIKVVKRKETGARPEAPPPDASPLEMENFISKVDDWNRDQEMVDFYFPPAMAEKKTTTLEVTIDPSKTAEEFHWDSADFK